MGQTSSNQLKFDSKNLKEAICVIGIKKTTSVFGIIHIEELSDDTVEISGEISGLKPGNHGFHIHRCGNITECGKCCDHYNPHNRSHGGPGDSERHVGDLGNITADDNGVAKINIRDHLVKLSGPFTVIGRSFVIHESEDDLGKGGLSEQGNVVDEKIRQESLTTGNAGKRIGCGVIGIAE